MQTYQYRDSLPAAPLFREKLISANNALKQDFREWLFLPGMLYGAGEKWWGQGGEREARHEGLDICFYRTTNTDIKQIKAGTKIPVIYAGTVATVIDDFLGKSIFVQHEQFHRDGAMLYTAYGHTLPGIKIKPGKKIKGGDIIGTAADTRKKGGSVPCHIHVSTAWIPESQTVMELNWEVVKSVQLLDPLALLELPHKMIGKLEN